MSDPLLIARRDKECCLLPQMLNRHGLVAGATGTGKTVTLQTMAEQFSRSGIPVFLADVKGDLAGLSQPGGDHPKVRERVEQLKIEGFSGEANPVMFWDVLGQSGHPLRATVSDLGPLLMARLLDLNDTQTGILNAVFKIADDDGLLLLDLKDLRSMVQYVGDNAKVYKTSYGNISSASIGAIQRGLLALETQGAEEFFGEPALDIFDLLQADASGRGIVHILAADQLFLRPRVYAAFLLWLLSELFEQLPEVGDPEKPRLVFFFDEAHVLFDGISKALQDKLEQVVRLIRSKGVGVFFVTQNPLDIPDEISRQLGNRVQHALRAFTPREKKAVHLIAQTFRANPEVEVEPSLTEMGVGEALVSFLDEKGRPHPVERSLVIPPRSRIGTVTSTERSGLITSSRIFGRYDKAVDRESAYELLQQKAAAAAREEAAAAQMSVPSRPAPSSSSRRPGRPRDSLLTAMSKSAARTIGRKVGDQIIRGLLGSLLGKRR